MSVDGFRNAPWSVVAGLAVAVAVAVLPRVLIAQGAPPAPANLASWVSGSTVGLSWAPGAGTVQPVVYRLEVGSAVGAANLAVASFSGPGVVVPNVPDGVYWVRVRAVNAAGRSSPSNEISVRVGCVGPPALPAGLVAVVNGASVGLAWQASAGATGYVLEAGSASSAADIAVLPTAATTLQASAPPGRYYVRVRALNRCGASGSSNEVAVTVVAGTIFGIVDAAILGTCSAATHDKWVVDGGDGYRYRTWHPQTDPSGCIYAHEHGDNPASMRDAEIASSPVRFGYIGRRHPMPNEPHGHEEPHEGFKVFIANVGDVNDEGRVNRAYSRSVFHMGTGGPRRFGMQMHSAEIRVVHPEFGLKAFTQLMMDTGGLGRVCDPRVPGATKDVIALDHEQVCGAKLGSGYEIWRTEGSVRAPGGREVYHAFAHPAVFDPITVLNPTNPTELVYAWDPRVMAIRRHNDDWSVNRGCDRESYAQPGYWYNAGGPTIYYTDAMGQPSAATNPLALRQTISASNSVGAPTTADGLNVFKKRVSFCQQWSRLGLKN
jgi:hypothetical protein